MASYTDIQRRLSERFRHLLNKETIVRPLNRISNYVRRLPPGDRFIVGVLGTAVGIASFAGIIALERYFLVEVPVRGGSLTEGVVGTPRFVNPLLALSDTDRDLTALTYAGLMGYDSEGILVPVLAESYTLSEDQMTYTFTLREGIVFSDGNPVTASDVVFTIERAQDPSLKSPELSNWANIRAEAVDARTVRFTLPKVYAPFLKQATLGILPAHIWEGLSPEEFPFSPYMTQPVGAGPFEFAAVKNADGGIASYEVAAFDDYALGRPYLDRVRFVFYDDYPALSVGLRSGEVESAYGIAREGARAIPYARVFGVFFNPVEEPAFTELAVRHALSVAIDRQALIDKILGGYGTPALGPLPAGSGIPELPVPDPETRRSDARGLLEDAGWTFDNEAQMWTRGDDTLSVTLETANVPELKAIASYIQEEWQAIGVPVAIELHPASTLTENVIRPRAFEALLFGEVIGTNPDLYAFWYSGERNDPGLNIAGYANSEVDELLERARSETDQATMLQFLAEANEIIAAEYPAAFTHTPDFLYTLPSELKGIALTRVAAPSDRLRSARFWYRQTELVWPVFTK